MSLSKWRESALEAANDSTHSTHWHSVACCPIMAQPHLSAKRHQQVSQRGRREWGCASGMPVECQEARREGRQANARCGGGWRWKPPAKELQPLGERDRLTAAVHMQRLGSEWRARSSGGRSSGRVACFACIVLGCHGLRGRVGENSEPKCGWFRSTAAIFGASLPSSALAFKRFENKPEENSKRSTSARLQGAVRGWYHRPNCFSGGRCVLHLQVLHTRRMSLSMRHTSHL